MLFVFAFGAFTRSHLERELFSVGSWKKKANDLIWNQFLKVFVIWRWGLYVWPQSETPEANGEKNEQSNCKKTVLFMFGDFMHLYQRMHACSWVSAVVSWKNLGIKTPTHGTWDNEKTFY